MSVKTACYRAALYCTLATFGVCSVSFESKAYPLSSVQTIKFSRSARENPKNQKQVPAVEESIQLSPYSPGTHNLSLGIGQVFLLGDLGNAFENAIGPEIHYNYGVSDLFAFESNFGYHSHSSGGLSIWNLAAGLRANMMYFDQLIPFTTIGLGFYHPSYKLANNTSVSGLLFGLQLGGGVDLLLSKQVFFGTRLTYNDMFSSSKKDSSGNSRELGGSFLSFMIHAGMTF